MKRLQRKVRNSNSEQPIPASENVSRALTFDRRTFLECSTRMRRLVPTLSRQHNNAPSCDFTLHPPTHQDGGTNRLNADDEDQLSESNDDNTDALTIFTADNCANTGEAVRQNSLIRTLTTEDREIDPSGIIGVAAIATLPRNSVMTCNPSSFATSATLPNSIATQKDRRAGRRIWLKPLTSFVAFMSSIGDNIHITSYPTQ